jgi:hypothetical protein
VKAELKKKEWKSGWFFGETFLFNMYAGNRNKMNAQNESGGPAPGDSQKF